MQHTLCIRGEGACVTIRVKPYDPADYGFVSAEVEVKVAAFHGTVRAGFWLDQFVQFRSDLERMQRDLSGRAELLGLEDCRLLVEMGITGRARVTGSIASVGQANAQLSFEIDTDQTYLAASLREMNAVLQSWPMAPSLGQPPK